VHAVWRGEKHMKYWTELMQFENALIEFESVYNTLKAVNCGIHQLSTEEMELALWNVERQMDNLNSRLKSDFNVLFDTIRGEDEQPKKKKGKKGVIL
jgi:hypothetical protein